MLAIHIQPLPGFYDQSGSSLYWLLRWLLEANSDDFSLLQNNKTQNLWLIASADGYKIEAGS
jgi:hypothetical protein